MSSIVFSFFLFFFFFIEEDLDKASVARMNEYGTSDDVKESFDTLQQRVKIKHFLENQCLTNSS